MCCTACAVCLTQRQNGEAVGSSSYVTCLHLCGRLCDPETERWNCGKQFLFYPLASYAVECECDPKTVAGSLFLCCSLGSHAGECECDPETEQGVLCCSLASHAVKCECDPETEQWSCGKPFLCHLLPLHAVDPETELRSQRLIVLTWCYWLALHVVDWPWLNRQSSEVWETFLVLPACITGCGPTGKAAEALCWCKLQAVHVVDTDHDSTDREVRPGKWFLCYMLASHVGRDRAVRSEEWFWCCVIELCAVGWAGPRDRAVRYLLASHVIDLETEHWDQRNGFGVA